MSQHGPREIKAEFTPRYGEPQEFIFLLCLIVFCGGEIAFYGIQDCYFRLYYSMWKWINPRTLDPGLEVLNGVTTDFKYMISDEMSKENTQ